VKSEFMMIVPIYAKVSFDTTKNKPVLGLVAKIDGKAISFLAICLTALKSFKATLPPIKLCLISLLTDKTIIVTIFAQESEREEICKLARQDHDESFFFEYSSYLQQ
jgi:hypothetical protein